MSFKKTLCKIQNSVVQFPCIHPDDVVFRPDDENFPSGRPSVSRSFKLFKVASVLTSQQHVQTPCNVRQVKRFLSKTQIWEGSCNHPDGMAIVKDVQLSGRQTPWPGRSILNMEIACSRSATIQMLGQHCLDAALFRKEFQVNLERRVHSCPSRRPQLLSRCRLGKS
jgi:hypothetical protein